MKPEAVGPAGFPSKKQLAHMQHEAEKAWNTAQNLKGSPERKMQLIYDAHPQVIRNTIPFNGRHLGVGYSSKYKAWSITDLGGFLTMVDGDDLDTLLALIKAESVDAGSTRKLVTGHNPFHAQQIKEETEAKTAYITEHSVGHFTTPKIEKMLVYIAVVKDKDGSITDFMQHNLDLLTSEMETRKKAPPARGKSKMRLADLGLDLKLEF